MANGNGTNVTASPVEDTPGSALFGNGGSDESPFLDYELEDGNFEWDNNGDQLFGDLPEYPENGEHHDKRKASTDDDDEEEGSSKRREGDDRSTKKLGRKPLTAEPTSVTILRSDTTFTPLTLVIEAQGTESSCTKSVPRAEGASLKRP